MAFKKYQSTEKVDVVSPEGHKAISADLKKVGKTSAAKLTEDERAQIRPLDKQ